MTPEARFWSRIYRAPSGCWIWTGESWHGYGRLWVNGRRCRVHRFAYELIVGPIPSGLEPDHLCRNTLCANPGHMALVSHRTNVLRGNSPAARLARRSVCDKGHPFDSTRSDGGRRCLTCRREQDRRRRQREEVSA